MSHVALTLAGAAATNWGVVASRSAPFGQSAPAGFGPKPLDEKPAQRAMNMIAEYLERALEFERMAEESEEAAFKEALLKQAASYRNMATARAAKLSPPPPQSK